MPMTFRYLKSARLKLQERKNACLRANFQSGGTYIRYLLEFVRTDPIIGTIHAQLARIAEDKYSDVESLVDAPQRRVALPADESECAALCLRWLEVFNEPAFDRLCRIFAPGSGKLQERYDDFAAQIIPPLFSYIDERIDDGDMLLYTLARYQRECSWFEADALAELAGKTASNGLEAVMDDHLRSWLFREGIDFPFSTPNGPSGRADVVVWHAEKPLAIEVKVFDGQNRDAGHVSQGLWQAQRYAIDYGASFGYLVIFNTSPYMLSFDGNAQKEGPPCVLVGGTNVFAITIEVGERAAASKEKPRATKVVKTPTGPNDD